MAHGQLHRAPYCWDCCYPVAWFLASSPNIYVRERWKRDLSHVVFSFLDHLVSSSTKLLEFSISWQTLVGPWKLYDHSVFTLHPTFETFTKYLSQDEMFQETGEKIPLELFCCLSRDMWHSWAHMEHPAPCQREPPPSRHPGEQQGILSDQREISSIISQEIRADS